MIRSITTFVFLLASLIALIAQQPDYCIQGRFSQIPYFAETEIVTMKNVTYGWAPRWPSTVVDTLKMDIYMPDPAIDPLAVRPFILLIHGGSFINGQKEDMEASCRDYARRGYVAATMSYRLGWDCNPVNLLFVCATCGPEVDKLRVAAYRSVQDARAALRFSASQAGNWGIDTSSFFIGGTSAGSVAAVHAIYLDQETANTFCPGCINAVGSLDSAVNTIQADYTIRALLNNCGAVLLPEALDNAPELPVISFHDDGDCVVPSDLGWALGCLNCTSFFQGYGSQQIHAYAGSKGTCSELNLRLGSLSHCSFPNATVVNRSSCFMKKIFCGSCTSGLNNNINAIETCDQLGGPVSTDDDAAAGRHMRVYPNPSNGLFFLDFIGSFTMGETLIQIYDMTGRELGQMNRWTTPSQELDLSHLQTGFYMIRATGSDHQFVQKIQLTN
jgi:hypothetical protein